MADYGPPIERNAADDRQVLSTRVDDLLRSTAHR